MEYLASDLIYDLITKIILMCLYELQSIRNFMNIKFTLPEILIFKDKFLLSPDG